jgi:branched-chain amino acid transport system substrate-binding protein
MPAWTGRVVAITLMIVAGAAACVARAQQPAQTVTVYSSLPLSGQTHRQAQAIVRGARLALDEAGGAAGGQPVRYVSLDDATKKAGELTPERTASDARRAVEDPSALAYIGEFNSGATAVSLPIVNEGGLPQISPANTAIGLTRGGPGTAPGEPDKYYPTGRRQYFRLTPNDRVQGAALAAAMRHRGCRRVAVLTDGDLYGTGIGASTQRTASRLGLRVVFTAKIRQRRKSYARLAARVRRAGAGCVAFSGITPNGAVALFRSLSRVLPRARLFGPEGIGDSRFTDPRRGGVPARVGHRVLITVTVLSPSAYPPAGQDFFRRYAARYADPRPDPYAVYGYEAMRLVLDAVTAVGPNRQAVIRRLRTMPTRAGALGTYRFDRFGDTTLRTVGLYRIRAGAPAYAGAVAAP